MISKAQFASASVLVFALFVTLRSEPHGARNASFPQRLLGPISNVAAGWQWVRVRLALDAGQRDLAYSRAELALELDPRATDSWLYLASNMAFDRASPYRQPQLELRTRWTEIALDLLSQGEASADRPAELALHAGSILVAVGESEGEIPWQGGPRAAFDRATSAFERATRFDPGLEEGWVQRAAHQSLRMGSPEITPEPEQRVQALVRALELLDEGELISRQVSDIHFERGLLLALFADGSDSELWPGGREALYRKALASFATAESEHHPLGADARRSTEEVLRSLWSGS